MLFYFLQVGLLMLAAYLLGAMMGCFLHRLVAGGSTVVPVEPEVIAGGVAATGAAVVAGSATGGRDEVVQVARDPDRPVIETVAIPTPPEARVDTANRFERVLDEAPVALAAQPVAEAPEPAAAAPAVPAEPAAPIIKDFPDDRVTQGEQVDQGNSKREEAAGGALAAASAVAATAAAATAAAAAARPPSEDTPATPAPSPEPAKPETPVGPLAGLIAVADGPADDLKRIRSIDTFIEGKLNAVGVTRYSQIAGLTAPAVEALGGRVGETLKINQENWIEQAALLARGSDTAFSRAGAGVPATGMWDLKAGDGGYTGPIFGGAMVAAGATAVAGVTGQGDTSAVAETTVPSEEASNAIADDARASVYGLSEPEKPGADEAKEPEPAPEPIVADSAPRNAIADDARDVYGSRAFEEKVMNDPLTIEPVQTLAPIEETPVQTKPVPPKVDDKAAPAVAKGDDDLKRIRGIDPATEAKLKSSGITSYQTIADFTPGDVVDAEAMLNTPGRIGRQNWIEQATVLARGGSTHFSNRFDAGEVGGNRPAPEGAAVAAPGAKPAKPAGAGAGAAKPAGPGGGGAAPPKPQPPAQAKGAGNPAGPGAGAAKPAGPGGGGAAPQKPQPPAQANVGAKPAGPGAGAAKPAGSGGAAAPKPPTPEPAAPAKPKPATETAAAGVAAAAAAAAGVAAAVGSSAAAKSPPDTPPAGAKPAPPPSPPPKADPPQPAHTEAGRADLAPLRSVRSEALRGPPDAAGGAPDDLKRIRGVGMLIEKKLNSLGVSRFEQIANWTNADIDRMSQVLDFQGRIERESWVEQARILSAGGNTEFSRRFERPDRK